MYSYSIFSQESTTLKPFQPSSPAKEIGGSKSGCFTNYPTHSADPYTNKKNCFRQNNDKQKNIFRPSQGPKSRPVNSIQAQNIDRYEKSAKYICMSSIFFEISENVVEKSAIM